MNKETNYWKTAEQMNGRLAMMGFFAAVINYGITGWIIPGIVQTDTFKSNKKNLFSVITEEVFALKFIIYFLIIPPFSSFLITCNMSKPTFRNQLNLWQLFVDVLTK